MCLSSSFLVITTAPIPRCECVYTTTRANHSRGTPTPRLYFTLKRTGGIFEHSGKPPIAVTPGIASTEACPHGVLGSTYYCLTWPPAILASSLNSSYCLTWPPSILWRSLTKPSTASRCTEQLIRSMSSIRWSCATLSSPSHHLSFFSVQPLPTFRLRSTSHKTTTYHPWDRQGEA